MKTIYTTAVCCAAVLCTHTTAVELPDAIKAAGTLHASVNAMYPPMEYKDTVTDKLAGHDVDLGQALAKLLGVRIDWTESAFKQLMSSLKAGRADCITSGMSGGRWSLPSCIRKAAAGRCACCANSTRSHNTINGAT